MRSRPWAKRGSGLGLESRPEIGASHRDNPEMRMINPRQVVYQAMLMYKNDVDRCHQKLSRCNGLVNGPCRRSSQNLRLRQYKPDPTLPAPALQWGEIPRLGGG